MTNDGSHGYAYDAEGNILAVDGGATASYVYDALNRRVRADVGASAVEYVFDQAGRRAGEWDGHSLAQLRGHYYWGGTPLAYYTTSPAATHFEHQDYLGNERVRTSYAGAVEGTFAALPFGDGAASSGADTDPHHFAGLDHDAEDSTEHAQFRNYSSAQGRWLAPDPYDGSYDITDPQSLNRYAYVLNNPLSFTDQLGLEDDDGGDNGGCDPGDPGCDPGGGGGGGDGGDGGGGSGGSYGASYGQYPPGTVLVDENGNYWVVNQNGGLDPTNPPGTAQWDYVNGGGCSPSDPACAAWLSTLTSWPNQGSGNGPCAPPFVCPTPLRPAPNKPAPPPMTPQQQAAQHAAVCKVGNQAAALFAIQTAGLATVGAGLTVTGVGAPLAIPLFIGAGVAGVLSGTFWFVTATYC